MEEKMLSIKSILDDEQKAEVAEILYESFKAKMIHVWYHNREKEETIRLLREALNFDYGIYALLDGKVVGFLGADYGRGRRFFKFSTKSLIKTYGMFGGLYRKILYCTESVFVDSSVNSRSSRIFPIGVSSEARGQGVGSKLLSAFYQESEERGAEYALLEVIDSNPRAKRLYEKEGFYTTGYLRTSFFTKKAGFEGIHYMKKKLRKTTDR